jgi:hypothetical protein
MRGLAAIGIVSIALILYFSYSREFRRSRTREKYAMLVILCFGCTLSLLLLYKPNLPGPSDLTMPLFKPIARLIGLE